MVVELENSVDIALYFLIIHNYIIIAIYTLLDLNI